MEGRTQGRSSGFYSGGINVIRRSGNYMLARKGNRTSTLRFQTSSGSVNVYFN